MSYPSFPRQVYVDTSYLIRLICYPRDRTHPRNIACKNLYDHLLSSGTEVVASTFTIEETCFILVWKFELRRASRASGYGNVKDFRRSNPSGFASLYALHKDKPKRLLQTCKTLGIQVKTPRYLHPGLNAAERVSQYYAELLRRYDCLDSKDAMHVAHARAMRIDMLISLDGDFSTVSQINSFCP